MSSVVLGVTGCATGAAQQAYDRGDDPAAATLADDGLRARPGDARLISLRQQARDRFTQSEVVRIQGFRSGRHGEAALVETDRLLKQIHGWGGADGLSPAAHSALDAELAAIPAVVAGLIDGDLAAGHPLAAEKALARIAPLVGHPELSRARQDAADKTRATGQTTCTRLQQSPVSDSPHWALTVGRYCEHFGAAANPIPAAQLPVTAFEITGTVKGMNADQVAALRGRITEWVRASLWNDPLRGPTGRGTIEGAVESSFRRQTVSLHTEYEDTITVTTPSFGIAPRPVDTVGNKRTLPRVGTVGNEPTFGAASATMNRTFTYDAEELRGHYGMNVTVRLDIGTPTPVTLRLKKVEDEKGYEHDVTFEPAGISPQRDRVPSADEWIRSKLDGFATRVTWALNRQFVRTLCDRAQYSVEEAARCLVAGLKPTAALSTLTAALGENAESVMPLLRPIPPERVEPTPAQAKARPPRPAAVTADDEDPIVN